MTRTATCPKCGQKYVYFASELSDRLVASLGIRALCEACSRPDNEIDPFLGLWARQIGAYRRADPTQVPPGLRPTLFWRPGGAEAAGIGITGPPGIGKSMALALALKSLRRSFRWLSGPAIRQVATDAAAADGGDRETARREWDRFRRVPALVIDDLDKAKFTDAWASRLFELLEKRNSSGLITMWTANNPVGTLGGKIGRDCGDIMTGQAIERRLCEASLVISL